MIIKTYTKQIHTFTLFTLCWIAPHAASAQSALTRAGRSLEYSVQAQISAGSGNSPFWLTANRYGLSSVNASNGFLRASIYRNADTDSMSLWRIGYGADIAIAYNHTATAIINQLYADINYRNMRLSIGAKQEPMALKNNELSSGSQTFGMNARPIPQVRFGVPEYLNISGKRKWAAIKGFIGYGMLTDGKFQKDYVVADRHYARRVLYHAKAGYLRLGNASKFPLTFEGGLEMAALFGGTVYNAQTWEGVSQNPIHMSHGVKDFIRATFGVGGDATDGYGYANSTGNSLGSWIFKLNYQAPEWQASIYYDHFFEDHSQMFFEYGWRDGLYGVELQLPRNRLVTGIVYEFLNTTYQSGSLYHDATDAIPEQISGVDNYYNHNLYAGWQHWGQALGNPLFIAPLYNRNGDLTFTENRFRAHHVGVNGNPTADLRYRMLYTHERSIGNYGTARPEALTTHSFLAEMHYAPECIGRIKTQGWELGLALGLDRGDLLGNNFGFNFSLTKKGLLIH